MTSQRIACNAWSRLEALIDEIPGSEGGRDMPPTPPPAQQRPSELSVIKHCKSNNLSRTAPSLETLGPFQRAPSAPILLLHPISQPTTQIDQLRNPDLLLAGNLQPQGQ